jgi:tetratricopeptide (TPR) repeat protein
MTTPEIRLCFDHLDKKADFDAPVPVRVRFKGCDRETEKFDFTNPLTEQDLGELRWYLERYWVWPSGPDYDRARKVEASLPQWGQDLFDAIFKAEHEASSDARFMFADFERERKDSGGGTLVIDGIEPRVLRLPWELLADEGGYLFSKQPPIQVRRRLHHTRKVNVRDFEPPLRVLVAVSRPKGAGFIDPRSIAAPMLDALEALDQRVAVEFLRPPTLKALTDRLRDRDQPPVDIVHFDGHGVYDPGIGLGFLLFEDDEHKKDLVDAERLGTLLNECGIPLVVLNACQSAQPDERNPFGSVAARLIESGIGGVVAMNYSVLVEAAKRLAGSFYGGLAQGHSVGAALDEARYDLLADTKRHTRYHPERGEETIHLQDWFLPALYQQAEDLTPFPASPTSPSPDELRSGGWARSIPRLPDRAGFPPEPVHGFRGRARELLSLERAFAQRPIHLLHGFGGQGKTALATQAAGWFTRTGLFDRAVFLSFEQGGGLDLALSEFGAALVGENFAIHEGDPVEAIADALAKTPTLMVWDNFESVLPGGNAPLSPEELGRLLAAGEKWFGTDGRRKTGDRNQSRLLITTRNPEIPRRAYQPGRHCRRHELEGLLPNDALELAAAVLDDYGVERPPRQPLTRLMGFLGGHPLSLQLALPHLKDFTVEELTARFDELLPGFTEGEGAARNESLTVSLRFSLDRLGEGAQKLLPRLAVFEGGAWEPALLSVTEIPEETWQTLKTQLANTALIRVEEIPGVQQPYLHFHPTLVPYLRRQWQGDGGQWVVDGESVPDTTPDSPLTTHDSPLTTLHSQYWQAYYALANQLYQLDTQHPHQARAIVRRELPNLRRALTLALGAGALDAAVDFADSINRFLNVFGRWRERDEVMAEVSGVIDQVSGEEGDLTQAQFVMESGRGERLRQRGRAGKAEEVFRGLLARMESHPPVEAPQGDLETRMTEPHPEPVEGAAQTDSEDWGYERSYVLVQLGRCLEAQGHPGEAERHYRQAIKVAEKLEQSESVKRHIGAIHTGLADVLVDQGRYAQAEKEYKTGLELATEVDDERQQGVVLGQLGTLALMQRNYAEARRRYNEALKFEQAMGEDQGQAIWWHQLGRVAEEQADWDEAARCYRESLAISERMGNLSYAAQTANQLAIVAVGAGRPAEAERWYLRTAEYAKLLPDQGAGVYTNLADLYLNLNRLEEAETYVHKAREIKEGLGLSARPWTTYGILAGIAEQRGQTEEARRWRRKAQETYEAFAGTDYEMQQFEPVIGVVVAACQGNQEAQEMLETLLVQLSEQGGEQARLADILQRILDGERDEEKLLEKSGRKEASFVKRILGALAGETPGDQSPGSKPKGAEAPSSPAQEQGISLAQLFELVERAAGASTEPGRSGDQELGQQLFDTFRQMSADPNAPAELRELAKVLVLVLIGERDPDLDALGAQSPELASAVRGLLGRLKHG